MVWKKKEGWSIDSERRGGEEVRKIEGEEERNRRGEKENMK